MDLPMNQDKLKNLIASIPTDQLKSDEIEPFIQQIRKHLIEQALQGEMDTHLGYDRYKRHSGTNSRNGSSKKTLKTEKGPIAISVPRDRNDSFEPQIVPKGQTRTGVLDDQIIALYSKGISTREITETIKELYDVDMSATLISNVTGRVINEVIQWQNRSLDAVYPVVFMDCIVVKVPDNQRVVNKAIFVALGINLSGNKELLGLWLAENEGAKFRLSVLTELKNQGVEDILIACINGLKGFSEAIEAVYPNTQVQLCVVHMVRNSMRFVSWKDYKRVAAQLRTIYQAATEQQALEALEQFDADWKDKYPVIVEQWRRHWDHLITMFNYPEDTRRVIYTTNAIESVNSVIRKATTRHKMFPNDEAALKVVYLAIDAASKKWTMPIRNWRLVLVLSLVTESPNISKWNLHKRIYNPTFASLNSSLRIIRMS